MTHLENHTVTTEEQTMNDDMSICIALLTPKLFETMQALRTSHPQIPLAAFAGAAANALRIVAINETAADLAKTEVDWVVPRALSSLKLDLAAEFVLAMRGGQR